MLSRQYLRSLYFTPAFKGSLFYVFVEIWHRSLWLSVPSFLIGVNASLLFFPLTFAVVLAQGSGAKVIIYNGADGPPGSQ